MFPVYFEVLLLFVFVAISAFFAAGEVAFLSISPVRLHLISENGTPGSESLSRLRANRRKVVISLLIGGNVANVAASALATSAAMKLFGDAGIGVAVGLMSFILLTFGDIAPKSAATSYGEKIALSFAPFIEIFYKVSYPLVTIFEAINRLIPWTYSTATGIEKFGEEDVLSAVKLGAKHKGISEKELRLIENVLKFNDKPVSVAMTPKSKLVCLLSELPVSKAHHRAVSGKYSRLPVINRQNKIVGIVSVKHLGRVVYEIPGKTVGEVCYTPTIFKATEKLHTAFEKLQSAGMSIALVADPHGEFAGMVTLEDILEEIVGELE
ncbi:MAG: CNNM domain-containing protein [archaeon]